MGLFDTKIPVHEAFATVVFDFKNYTPTTATTTADGVYQLASFQTKGDAPEFSVTSIEYKEVINQLPTCVFTCFNKLSTTVASTMSFQDLKDEHSLNLRELYGRDKFAEAKIGVKLLEYNNGSPSEKNFYLQGFVSTPTTQLTPNGIQQTYTLIHKDLLFGEFDTRIYEFNNRELYGSHWESLCGDMPNFTGTNLFGAGGVLHSFIKKLVDLNFEEVTSQADAILNIEGNNSARDHILLQGNKNKTYFTDYIEPFLTSQVNVERTNILIDYLESNDLDYIEQIAFKANILSLFQQSGNFYDFLINICNYFNLEYIATFVTKADEEQIPSRVQTCKPIRGEEKVLDEKLTYFTYDMDYSKNLVPISSVVLEGNLTPTYYPYAGMTSYNAINYQETHIVGRFPLIKSMDLIRPKYGRVLRVKAPAWLITCDDKSEVIRDPIILVPSGEGQSTRNPEEILKIKKEEGQARIATVLKKEQTVLDTFAKALYEINCIRDFRAHIGTPLVLDYSLGNIYDVKAKGEKGEEMTLFKGYSVSRSFNFLSQNNNINVSMSVEFTHTRVDDWMPYPLK